jgi:putative ABC transport system permease protein
VLEGRGFLENHGSDKKKIVVNESFLAASSLIDPIGGKFRIDTADFEIVGVVRDFHNYSFDSKISPTVLMLADQKDFRYLTLRTQNDKGQKVNNDLQASWTALFPETPFIGGLQIDVWGPYFEKLSMHANFWQTIAGLAILLAGLGLYGLVALNVAVRVREFSIRKVLGASIKSSGGSVMKQFLPLFLISLTAGAVLSYNVMGAFFDFIYEYHIPMNLQGVLVALILLIVVLLLAVVAQLNFISKSNPVVGLKTE